MISSVILIVTLHINCVNHSFICGVCERALVNAVSTDEGQCSEVLVTVVDGKFRIQICNQLMITTLAELI